MEETNNKKITIVLIVVVVMALLAILLYFFKPSVLNIITKPIGIDTTRPTVIDNEQLVIPDTQKITGAEGRVIEKGSVEVLLTPQNEGEKIVVPKAILTVVGVYDMAKGEAEKWSGDTLPVFIKSLGAVTLDGKSSQWQAVFSSTAKKGKGYEIIIQGDAIVSQKELGSSAKGVVFPVGMKDSGDFIKEMQGMPHLEGATISSMILSSKPESTDSKWRFSISTSKGTATFQIR